MKPDEFLNIKKEMDKWTDRLLFEKSKEYGTDDDRFDNIRTISRISGESVETCLKVLICKHIASYLDILDGKLEPTDEIIREKFGDIHNYLYITEGVLREYNEKGESGVFHHGDTSPKDLDVPLTYEKKYPTSIADLVKDYKHNIFELPKIKLNFDNEESEVDKLVLKILEINIDKLIPEIKARITLFNGYQYIKDFPAYKTYSDFLIKVITKLIKKDYSALIDLFDISSFEVIGENEEMKEFGMKLTDMQDIEPEFAKIVNEHFFDLIGNEKGTTRRLFYCDKDNKLQSIEITLPPDIPQDKKVNIEILDLAGDEKDTQIPVVELTKAELKVDRKIKIRKEAEKMYEVLQQENECWYFLDDIIVDGYRCKYIKINHDTGRIVLNLKHENGDFDKSNLMPNARKDDYIAIFEKLLTDPEKFIKSYFGV